MKIKGFSKKLKHLESRDWFMPAKKSDIVIVTTIQTEAAYQILTERGVLFGDRLLGEFTSDNHHAMAAYDWMKEQMRRRIWQLPSGAKDPLWAWVRWGWKNAPVDLRRMPWTAGTRPFWRIDIAVPKHLALLSCYDKWHFPLNNFHFMSGGRDEVSQKEREASWDEVFRTGSRTSTIQATMWEIRREWIIRASFHR